jgi:hypothetical protein
MRILVSLCLSTCSNWGTAEIVYSRDMLNFVNIFQLCLKKEAIRDSTWMNYCVSAPNSSVQVTRKTFTGPKLISRHRCRKRWNVRFTFSALLLQVLLFSTRQHWQELFCYMNISPLVSLTCNAEGCVKKMKEEERKRQWLNTFDSTLPGRIRCKAIFG